MKYKVGDRVRMVRDYEYAKEGMVGRIVSITKGKPPVGIEFDDSLVAFHNCLGNSKDRHGYFVFEKDIEVIEAEEIHITRKGNEVIAVHKQGDKVKKSVAKCSPEDEFDFMTGAKLAFERLNEADKPSEAKFVPHLVDCTGRYLGNIGEETVQTAVFGEKLCVGDVVEAYASDTNHNCGMDFVCKSVMYPNGFVVGLASCKFKCGIDNEWQIRKVKSYKDLKHGETIDGVKAVLREGKSGQKI